MPSATSTPAAITEDSMPVGTGWVLNVLLHRLGSTYAGLPRIPKEAPWFSLDYFYGRKVHCITLRTTVMVK